MAWTQLSFLCNPISRGREAARRGQRDASQVLTREPRRRQIRIPPVVNSYYLWIMRTRIKSGVSETTKEVEELLSGPVDCHCRVCACQGTAPVARAVKAESSVDLGVKLCAVCDWAPRVEGSQPVSTCLRGTSEA